MRTLAKEPRALLRARPAKSTLPNRAHSGRMDGVDCVLQLQRTIGNRAVHRLLQAPSAAIAERSPTLGLGVGHGISQVAVQTDASAEKAADSTADQVMHTPEPGVRIGEQEAGSGPAIQGREQTLPSRDRAFFERRFGHDFSQVRVHADNRSAEMADALNADAFTVGRDIYVGAGKLQPRSLESNRLLAHELTHVVQQSRTGPAIQPKLKMSGKPGDVTRALTLLNSGLRQYRVSVDKAGAVSITENFVELDPDPQQKALADRLDAIIGDPKDVIMSVSAGSKTLVGSYATGDVDIKDIESLGASALIHEIEEQYQKQVKGVAYGSEKTGAHGEGIKAESEVIGARRGPQKVISSAKNADGTLDLVVEIPYTYPGGKVKTMVMNVKRNDVVSVTWK